MNSLNKFNNETIKSNSGCIKAQASVVTGVFVESFSPVSLIAEYPSNISGWFNLIIALRPVAPPHSSESCGQMRQLSQELSNIIPAFACSVLVSVCFGVSFGWLNTQGVAKIIFLKALNRWVRFWGKWTAKEKYWQTVRLRILMISAPPNGITWNSLCLFRKRFIIFQLSHSLCPYNTI